MVLVYHDFFENYLSADGAKDSKLKENVVLTEIAKIIAVFPDTAADILSKSGVPVSKDVDLITMSNLIEQHAPTNTKLQELLAREIIKGNEEFNGKKYVSANGEAAAGLVNQENINAVAGIIGSVAGMFKNKKNKNKKNKAAANKVKQKSLADFVQQQKFQFLKAQGKVTEEREKKVKEENKWKPLITVTAIIIGFSALSYGLVYYMNGKK
jgi:hypothetical protein